MLLFYGSGAHRVLHSFPTRRSSDLADVSGGRLADVGSGGPEIRGWAAGCADVCKRAAGERFGGDWAAGGGAVCFDFGDRKSTRLNSSHTVISYAVFCLKKKKKKSVL